MDIKNMKNIIILKDLPSNVVEEAFVILKDNVKIHNKEITNIKDKENGNKNVDEKNINDNNGKNNNRYLIKEAEMIVNEYVSKVAESSIKNTNEKIKLQEKYKRLKYSNLFFILFSIFCIISILVRTNI